jgi:LPXTG-motif cell wall-anchored protein
MEMFGEIPWWVLILGLLVLLGLVGLLLYLRNKRPED